MSSSRTKFTQGKVAYISNTTATVDCDFQPTFVMLKYPYQRSSFAIRDTVNNMAIAFALLLNGTYAWYDPSDAITITPNGFTFNIGAVGNMEIIWYAGRE